MMMKSPLEWFRHSRQAPARALRLGWAALDRYLEAGGMRQGAAVAFYAAFSIAPLLVVVTGVMVWLLGSDAAQAALLDAVQRLIGANETKTLSELLAKRPADLGGQPAIFGSWVALGTTLVGATGVFIELRAGLQAMLDESDGDFSWWQLVRVRLLAIGVVLGCGFLLSVAMLAQTVSLIALKWASTRWPLLAPLLGAAESLWSWGVIALLFALMFRWLPNSRLPMRHCFAGAAVAAGLFMVGRYGISLYIETTATTSALGAAGSFAALLVWVYWSSQIFLLGASVAVELGHPERKARDTAGAVSGAAVRASP
jgi:membrane protein